MYRLRLISAAVVIPLASLIAYIGGPLYVAFITFLFTTAAREYARNVLGAGGFRPSLPVLYGATLSLVVGAYVTSERGRFWIRFYSGLPSNADLPNWLEWPHWVLGVLLALTVAATLWHIYDYERGAQYSASDWAFTMAGGVYLGLFGAYFVLVREDFRTDGRYWLLVVLPTQWLIDSAAMLVGKRFGRRKLAPRLSPGKTWEGYLGSIPVGVLVGAVIAELAAWLALTLNETVPFRWWDGAVIGLLCGVFTLFGDLAESLFKRQVQVKDSGNTMPGHGGIFDRMDSQMWAVVIGYYYYYYVLWAHLPPSR